VENYQFIDNKLALHPLITYESASEYE